MNTVKLELPEALKPFEPKKDEKGVIPPENKKKFKLYTDKWSSEFKQALERRIKTMERVGCHPSYIIMGYSTWHHATGYMKEDYSADRKVHKPSGLPVIIDMTVAEVLKVSPETSKRISFYMDPPPKHRHQDFMQFFEPIEVKL